ncbi:hypothetical protein PV10_05814 [Exophiala mesophila]|uniref:AB hydrolase-1 domain-containing protein n=1 Tax=Exophiala mesophila TaxID=212818 RepID=A0A0D1ZB85_EXOME|nr:uncharacterized protein PV10_05814 [Exophiala mesophila]KIV91254.1 hypothetical protein PV10_05814 [Exophiala mesophila]
MPDGGGEYSIYDLGDFLLESGEVLPSAFLAYKTFGDPSSPVLIYPTWYGGKIADCAGIVGPENAAFDPARYFIIILALFGNGESISPSNTPALRDTFPTVTFRDNVTAQYQLLTQKLGVFHARAALSWSMGAAQAFQWAVQYPEFVDAIIPYAGAAKTSIHNNVFLEGVKSALIASRHGESNGIGKGQKFPRPGSWSEDERRVGLKAFGRTYAGWGFSQTFYREKSYEKLGSSTPDGFLVDFWEGWALGKDPDNLLVMLQTWQLADISAGPEFQGDFARALRSIKAKTLVMPCETDLYFPPADSEIEVNAMSPGIGRLLVIPSTSGHFAAAPALQAHDWSFLHGSIWEFLQEVEAGLVVG